MSRTSRNDALEPAEREFAYVPRRVAPVPAHVHAFRDLNLVQRVSSDPRDCDECRARADAAVATITTLLHTSPWTVS